MEIEKGKAATSNCSTLVDIGATTSTGEVQARAYLTMWIPPTEYLIVGGSRQGIDQVDTPKTRYQGLRAILTE